MIPDPVITEFLKLGLIGAICIVLILVCWKIFVLYQQAMKDRVEDHRAFAAQYREALDANTDALRQSNELAKVRAEERAGGRGR